MDFSLRKSLRNLQVGEWVFSLTRGGLWEFRCDEENVKSKIQPIGFKKIIWKSCSFIFGSMNPKLANLFFFVQIFFHFFTVGSWVKDFLKEFLKDFVELSQQIGNLKIFLKLYLVVSSRWDVFRKWFKPVFILILTSLVV